MLVCRTSIQKYFRLLSQISKTTIKNFSDLIQNLQRSQCVISAGLCFKLKPPVWGYACNTFGQLYFSTPHLSSLDLDRSSIPGCLLLYFPQSQLFIAISLHDHTQVERVLKQKLVYISDNFLPEFTFLFLSKKEQNQKKQQYLLDLERAFRENRDLPEPPEDFDLESIYGVAASVIKTRRIIHFLKS